MAAQTVSHARCSESCYRIEKNSRP